MANALGFSRTFTPAIVVIAGLLALGIAPVQEIASNANSVNVQISHYEASAVGGILLG